MSICKAWTCIWLARLAVSTLLPPSTLCYVVRIGVTGYSLLASSWWPVLIESQSFSWSRMTFDSEHVVPAQQTEMMTHLCLRRTGDNSLLTAYWKPAQGESTNIAGAGTAHASRAVQPHGTARRPTSDGNRPAHPSRRAPR